MWPFGLESILIDILLNMTIAYHVGIARLLYCLAKSSMNTPPIYIYSISVVSPLFAIITTSYCYRKFFQYSCRDLLLFRYKTSKVRHRCWVMGSGSQSAFQFILKGFDRFKVWVNQVPPHQTKAKST